MSASPSEIWAPGLLGAIIETALYGVSIGQYTFYVQAFPRDMIQLKLLVSVLFLLDSIHSVAVFWGYYYILVACRSSQSPGCTTNVPQSFILAMYSVYLTIFMVQSFYAYRVWIISNRNRIITSVVMVLTVAQLVFGLLYTARVTRTPTFYASSTSRFAPLSAISSASCDVVITTSIYYYLRPAWTGVARRGDHIKKLVFVTVQMGVLSLINALAMAIAFYVEVHGVPRLLAAGPGTVLGKTYVNSMLSVLNARKTIREEREARAQGPIEIPTIPTIL